MTMENKPKFSLVLHKWRFLMVQIIIDQLGKDEISKFKFWLRDKISSKRILEEDDPWLWFAILEEQQIIFKTPDDLKTINEFLQHFNINSQSVNKVSKKFSKEVSKSKKPPQKQRIETTQSDETLNSAKQNTKATNRSKQENAYDKSFLINDSLGNEELKKLRYWLKGIVPKRILDKNDFYSWWQNLREQDVISEKNLTFLKCFLECIKRKDLLRKIGELDGTTTEKNDVNNRRYSGRRKRSSNLGLRKIQETPCVQSSDSQCTISMDDSSVLQGQNSVKSNVTKTRKRRRRNRKRGRNNTGFGQMQEKRPATVFAIPSAEILECRLEIKIVETFDLYGSVFGAVISVFYVLGVIVTLCP